MLDRSERDIRLARLQQDIQRADAATRLLMSAVIARGCRRQATTRDGGAAGRLGRLIATEAWTDAALALIELELPHWKLRRLAYEDGQWLCSLSRYPGFPPELDGPQKAVTRFCPWQS
jgi:hypothetical protein